MNKLNLKKIKSTACCLLIGLLLLNIPLSQAIVCLESDGNSNIEFNVLGSCDNQHDACKSCTDISLSQKFAFPTNKTLGSTVNTSFLQVTWTLPEIITPLKPTYSYRKRHTPIQLSNSYLAHRQSIILLI